jgi:hypothetical protein
MKISTAKKQVLQSIAGAFPCNAVLHTQTSFIEISIEAGILRSGKGAIHASVGLLSAVVFLAQNWYGISVSSLRMQLSQWLVTAVVS